MSAHDDVAEDRGLEGLSWFVAVPFMLVGAAMMVFAAVVDAFVLLLSIEVLGIMVMWGITYAGSLATLLLVAAVILVVYGVSLWCSIRFPAVLWGFVRRVCWFVLVAPFVAGTALVLMGCRLVTGRYPQWVGLPVSAE